MLASVALPLSSGSVVMGTGIVSVTLLLAGQQLLSRVLMALTALAWVAYTVTIGLRVLGDRERVREEARSPTALSAVAATAVLGSRLETYGLRTDATILLIIALAVWLGLSVLVKDALRERGGASFMLTVSVESLSVLAAAIAQAERSAWLTVAAMAGCALGLALYLVAIVRFDRRQVLVGGGDQWIAGGALAISALAAGECSAAAQAAPALQPAVATAQAVCVAVWIASVLWWIALVGSEFAAPRFRYDMRRWATVFPVGMYGASSFAAARAGGWHTLASIARVWSWVALAVWLAVAVGMARRLRWPHRE